MQVLFCYLAPGILAAIGVWHLAHPLGPWKLARLHSESEGLATRDAPTPGALKLLRVRGAFLLAFAIAFSVFSHLFFSDWRQS